MIAAATAWRAWYAGLVPLTGDEAYHWEWSRHLDWCYYDHPGMVAWVMRLFTLLGGETAFWIRLEAVLAGALAAWLIYLLAREAGGSPSAAARTCAVFLAVPLYHGAALVVTTDTPLNLFWLAALLFYLKAYRRPSPGWWLAGGAALGLASLSKFIAFLFVPALGLGLLLTPRGRRHLASPWPWLSLGLAAALFYPVVRWNAGHGWETFLFNFASRHRGAGGPGAAGLGTFLAGQALILSPLLFAWLAAGLVAAVRGRGAAEGDSGRERDFFLALFTAVPFLFFVAVSLLRSVGAHWPMAAYYPAFALAGARTFGGVPARGMLSARFLKGAAALGLAVTILLYAAPILIFGNPGAAVRLVTWAAPAGRERNLRSLGQVWGWRELGEETSRLLAEESRRGPVFLATPSYAFSSLLAFNTPGKPAVHLYGAGSVWGRNFERWDRYEEMAGMSMVYLRTKPPDDEVWRLLRAGFGEVGGLEEIRIPLPGYVRVVYLIRAGNFNPAGYRRALAGG